MMSCTTYFSCIIRSKQMTPKNRNKEPQLALGLKYSENRIIRFILYRARRISLILDQLTFWRSPVLWLLLFLNGVLIYSLLPLLTSDKLPPDVPIFYYGLTTETILFPSDWLEYLFAGFLATQFVSILVSSGLYYRLKQLSFFILLSSILTTFLFGITVFKSVTLTLPIS